MTNASLLGTARSKVRMVLEVLDQAGAYDPLEELRRQIAGLEERVARLEAGSSRSQDRPTGSLSET